MGGNVDILKTIRTRRGPGVVKAKGRFLLSALHYAASEGHAAAVAQLLEWGCADEIDKPDCRSLTPFHLGAFCGRLDVLKVLYSKFGERLLEQRDEAGQFAIHLAAGEFNDNADVVTQLIEWGGIKELEKKRHDGLTLFGVAALCGRADALRAMHAKGGQALLSQKEEDSGNFPIHAAAGGSSGDAGRDTLGHVAVVRQLVDWGGLEELDRCDEYGNTPFHLAALCGCIFVMEAMYAKAGKALLDKQRKGGYFPIHWAADKGHVAVVNQLVEWKGTKELDKCDVNDNTPLHCAASGGHVSVIEAMYAKGGKTLLDKQNKDGYFAIHWAADKGHVGAVERLIEFGGTEELDKRDKDDDTPLHRAALGGHVSVIEAMYAKGGKTLLDKQNKVSIHFAADKGHVDAVERLIEFGGTEELDKRDNDDNTPFHQAAICGRVSVIDAMHAHRGQSLLDTYGNYKAFPIHLCVAGTATEGDTPGHVAVCKRLMELGGKVELDKRDEGLGTTPFHTAVFNGYVELMKTMFAVGGKPLLDARSNKGSLPIHQTEGAHTVSSRHIAAMKQLIEWGGVKQLKEKTSAGNTPFHTAAFNGSIELMNTMYAVGGKPLLDARNNDGELPIHRAAGCDTVSSRHIAAMKQLIEWGGVKQLKEKTKAGKTPLDLAQSDEMRRLLSSYK
ncbi:unnamed protein product [Vitrella brassicaformis CCMP3155]|uniref:Uncharacterized protein n=1 Tax=Vitrella brassicaformis (strain CCMP3155) TaxID=1169540 RepID=A0A0G4GNI1_VITBC|nr:unnamed protein product [Vitrella brassicaformis CCMP3155]|eukprot:CEM31846.1 unnamed protein product [Vitrella brassicaformis CCMP3155]